MSLFAHDGPMALAAHSPLPWRLIRPTQAAANILGWDNGGGLSRDIDILQGALRELGWTVAINDKYRQSGNRTPTAQALGRARARFVRMMAARRLAEPPFELNFHLESIYPEHFPVARRNVLIPNQEFFPEPCRPHLGRIDEVWVKTRLAERLFQDLGCRVRFLGWASLDRRLPNAQGSKAVTALHIAGHSRAKGTEALVDVWRENPEWPLLRVLRRAHGYDGRVTPWRTTPSAPNVQLIADRMDEQMLVRMQNESALHICPSEAEGFGHIILEGMSVSSVVITTDAPPMNEMITGESGLLVSVDRSEPMSLGRRYFVNRNDLARQIRAALEMTDEQRDVLGRAARVRFEENNAAFRTRLKNYLELSSKTTSHRTESSGSVEASAAQLPRE
jgi:hypothetical protein